MGMQIIQQPDDKYAAFDSVTDTFCCIDATKEEIVKFFGDIARRRAEKDAAEVVSQLEAENDPYYGDGISWKEAAKTHRQYQINCPNEKFRAAVNEVLDRLSPKKKKNNVDQQ